MRVLVTNQIWKLVLSCRRRQAVVKRLWARSIDPEREKLEGTTPTENGDGYQKGIAVRGCFAELVDGGCALGQERDPDVDSQCGHVAPSSLKPWLGSLDQTSLGRCLHKRASTPPASSIAF